MKIEEMRQLKAERGYSNAQISRLSGVPLGTVRKIFSGITTSPRYETLKALERVFRDTAESRSFDTAYDLHGKCNLKVSDSLAPYLTKQQGEYTIEDYYALPDDVRVELIDGVIYDMTAPTTIHQMIGPAIFREIDRHIESSGGSSVPFMAPTDVHLDCDNKTMVQPDFFVICNRDRITKRHLEGAPDFAVEILSPSTRGKDSFTKAYKYMDAGVREYWIVDPDALRITVYLFKERNIDEVKIYTFKDTVPVAIFDGKCAVDFAKVYDRIRFLYEKEE